MEIRLNKSGFTPGEDIVVSAKINNQSFRTIKWLRLRLCQVVIYKFVFSNSFLCWYIYLYPKIFHRAKTFSGNEKTRTTRKTIVAKDGDTGVNRYSEFTWKDVTLRIPSIPPRLSKCKAISVEYEVEFQVSQGFWLTMRAIWAINNGDLIE